MAKRELIGEFLKKTREKKGISLEYISAQTKINYNVLKNLETDNLQELPNIAYVRGFVQHYIKIVNGDLDKAMDVLDYSYKLNHENASETVIAKPESTTVASTPPSPSFNDEIDKKGFSEVIFGFYDGIKNNKGTIGAFIIILAIGGGIFGIYKYINENVAKNININKTAKKVTAPDATNVVKGKKDSLFKSEKLRKIREENITAAAKEEADKKAAEAAKKAEEEKEAQKKVQIAKAEAQKIEEEEKEKTESTDTKEEVEKKLSSVFPYVKFSKIKFTKIYTIEEEADENNDPDLLPDNYKSRVDSDKQNILINAIYDKTWLSYTVDDGRINTRLLKQGQKLFIQGDEIAIFLGNVNATKIFYNNKLVSTTSKTGVKSLIFPESSIQNYYLPLFKSNKNGVLYKAKDYMEKMEDKET